ncbi:MAG: glycosyltransferase family 1 protein [Candidatus Moraniibacteriota bacterium]
MKISSNTRINSGKATGIKNYIQFLYESLQKQFSDNEFIFFQIDEEKILGKTFSFKWMRYVPMTNFRNILFDQFFILFLIIKQKPDVFHAPAHILPFIRIADVKYVVTVHDLAFLIYPKQYVFLFNLYYKYAIKRSLRLADRIIVVSENTKNDIIKFYNIEECKIEVIYSGINESFFENVKTKPLISEKYIFALTTHPKRKNIVSVLEALAHSNKLVEYKFIIAGLIENDQLRELKNKVYEYGLEKRVIIYGYVSDMELQNLYKNASFFIYPSFYEGFGFPVIEAMASRCPVITSNNSSLIEVTPQKKWLVDAFNIDDIREKMEDMASLNLNERFFLIQQNYEFASQFVWANAAKKTWDVFNIL